MILRGAALVLSLLFVHTGRADALVAWHDQAHAPAPAQAHAPTPGQSHDAQGHAATQSAGATTVQKADSAAAGHAATSQDAHPQGKAADPAHGAPVDHAEGESTDLIMPHILNQPYLTFPWLNDHGEIEIHLPTGWVLPGTSIDISPTKHSVMLLLAAVICAVVLIYSARSQRKRAAEGKPPRGLANAMEAIVLYMRSEIILPNVGHHGEKYVPYLLTTFFFILFANMLGLIPFAATATSNIAVTATLAVIAFLVVEISGMLSLGPAGYMRTIIYWPHDGNIAMKLMLALIISPIELMGKFTKPFALAIRLFANMTAGHIIVLAFIGLIFTFGNIFIAPIPFMMATAIMLLEVLVAFLQAFIFTLLVSVFIGQVRVAH